jgi:hypothetical protein
MLLQQGGEFAKKFVHKISPTRLGPATIKRSALGVVENLPMFQPLEVETAVEGNFV